MDKLCQSGAHFFDYEERNLTSSQIHALLIDSIMQMIKNCECLFFLNTSNSIPITGGSLSPWLFLELGVSKIIEKEPNAARREKYSYKKIALEGVECVFPMSLSHLIELSEENLNQWREHYGTLLTTIKMGNELSNGNKLSNGNETLYSLDVLYDLFEPRIKALEG